MKYLIDFEKFEKRVNESVINNTLVTLYHGSVHLFDKFTDEFVGKEEANDQNGPGIYLTDSEKEADGYAENGYTYEVELNANILYNGDNKITLKPKLIKTLAMMASDWEINAENWNYPANIGLSDFIKDTFDSYDSDKDILLTVWYDFYRYNPVDYVRNCVKLGIDGIIVEDDNRESIHYVIYNPNIIKIKNKKKS